MERVLPLLGEVSSVVDDPDTPVPVHLLQTSVAPDAHGRTTPRSPSFLPVVPEVVDVRECVSSSDTPGRHADGPYEPCRCRALSPFPVARSDDSFKWLF